MREIKIWDTKQAKKVTFVPIKENELTMYYCGPTVYNYVHLGNLRPVIVFDLLSRVFKEVGYSLKVVSNYTDIDDKIINRAKEEHKSEKEISTFYIKAYEECVKKLNALPLYNYPKASEVINEIQEFVSVLLDKGYAYKANDDIDFRIDKIKDYGCVSHTVIENNQAGKRIDVSDEKENPYDFALWKKTKDDGIKFDSFLGLGRPGWHTECVVMIKNVFNQPTIDIHGGGFDLKFPHHENERAQSIGYDGNELASYWMHVGFLTAAGGVKMSKSLGNVVLGNDILNKYSGNALRLFFYQSHYRAPIAFSYDAMDNSENSVNKYLQTLQKLSYKLDRLHVDKKEGEYDLSSYDEFLDYLCDDLNVANALSTLEKQVKIALTLLRNSKSSVEDLLKSYKTIYKMLDILGFSINLLDLTKDDETLLNDFDKAREEKDFTKSDELRKVLIEKGLI